jgi:hypothetical protein
MDISLSWKSVGSFVVMDFENRAIHQGHAVNIASNPIILFLLQRERDILFEAQGFPVIKGIVPPVIIPDAFFSEPPVVVGTVILSYNLDHIIPILFPTLMVEVEELFQGIEFGYFQVAIELFQGIVNPGTHEGFNAFCLDLNLINIGEFVLVWAGLKGGKL